MPLRAAILRLGGAWKASCATNGSCRTAAAQFGALQHHRRRVAGGKTATGSAAWRNGGTQRMSHSVIPHIGRALPRLASCSRHRRARTQVPGADRGPPLEQSIAFYRDVLVTISRISWPCMAGAVVGWCDVVPVFGHSRAHIGVLFRHRAAAWRAHKGYSAPRCCRPPSTSHAARGLDTHRANGSHRQPQRQGAVRKIRVRARSARTAAPT